jgi:hypothetical protein
MVENIHGIRNQNIDGKTYIYIYTYTECSSSYTHVIRHTWLCHNILLMIHITSSYKSPQYYCRNRLVKISALLDVSASIPASSNYMTVVGTICEALLSNKEASALQETTIADLRESSPYTQPVILYSHSLYCILLIELPFWPC